MLSKKKIGYWRSNISTPKLIKNWIIQKLLGFNRRVPWPVHWTTKVKSYNKIIPGTRCPGLSPGCYIDGRNGIIIGKNVWIGPNVSIISMNHDLNDNSKYIKEESIVIGDNCWLGAGTIILPRVKLGNHVVVGAGSVVTRSFNEDNIMIAGSPAKIIKYIGDYTND